MTQDATTPRAFKCPITHQTFHDPVLEADGHTYDKIALDQWDTHSKGLSPLTRQPLPNLPRAPNTTLARALADYREHQRSTGSQRDEWERHTESAISFGPLTLPVRLSDGHDYNRDEALQIIEAIGRSPFMDLPFEETEDLRPNRALQALSAGVHGFVAPTYPPGVAQAYRLMPAMPAPIGPPGEAAFQRIQAYWMDVFLQGLPLEDPEARRILLHSARTAVAIAAIPLRAVIDKIISTEQRAWGLAFLIEGGAIWHWLQPPPTPRLLVLAEIALFNVRSAADILNVNAAEDRTTLRFIEACRDFLSPRKRLCYLGNQANLRGIATGVAAMGTFAGFGVMAGAPYQILVMQAVAHSVHLGFFMAERAIQLKSANRPKTLRHARELRDMPQPQSATRRLDSWSLTAAGATVRAASTMSIAMGAGAILPWAIPVGWLSSDRAHYQRQIAFAAAMASGVAIAACHISRLLGFLIHHRR